MSASGPGPGPGNVRRTSTAIVGLAHSGGDDPVIVLVIHPPDYLTPVAAQISDDQARQLMAQLAAALNERAGGEADE